MIGTLTRKSTKTDPAKHLRTGEMDGYFKNPPTVGHRFAIVGKALDPTKEFREIRTSLVTGVREGELAGVRYWVFSTENSEYELAPHEPQTAVFTPDEIKFLEQGYNYRYLFVEIA